MYWFWRHSCRWLQERRNLPRFTGLFSQGRLCDLYRIWSRWGSMTVCTLTPFPFLHPRSDFLQKMWTINMGLWRGNQHLQLLSWFHYQCRQCTITEYVDTGVTGVITAQTAAETLIGWCKTTLMRLRDCHFSNLSYHECVCKHVMIDVCVCVCVCVHACVCILCVMNCQ